MSKIKNVVKVMNFHSLLRVDKARKEAIDARNDADAMVFQTEKALEEVGDKIDANDKTAVQAELTALKELLDKTNVDSMTDADVANIKEAQNKLMETAQKLFAKLYEQAQGAQAGPDMGGAAGAGYANDDVVDADYTQVD